MRDPYPENDEEPGPLLSFLLASAKTERPLDEAWLLCTGGTFLERARDLEREAKDEGIRVRFHPIDFPVRDVIDYAEIWKLLGSSFATISESAGSMPREWIFLLDSGTPQMKSSLFLAARSGVFPATLFQGIPARFAGGTYKMREVQLEGLPELRQPATIDAPKESPILFEREEIDEDPVVSSGAFDEVLRRAKAAARYDDPVLLLGETGTGKTMIARRIHVESSRKARPFVEVNCSAIAENLIESELFGHVRGAFTGADKARAGKFRAAQGGTLFLDEVGDLSLDAQAKLLKAIEDKEVTPVGSDEALSADARLITATNRDLPAMIKEVHFRHDLYERLKVIVIELPPLRKRREDIRPLSDRFLAAWNKQYSERRFLTEDAIELLESYSWPGNVRELQNALRSAACSAINSVLGPESLPDEIRRAARSKHCDESGDAITTELPAEGLNLKARLLQVEWEYVAAALRKTGDNREAAAKLLGMTGHALRKAMNERLAAYADEGWDEGM
jgi:DNA-binding NtrC family response regulator